MHEILQSVLQVCAETKSAGIHTKFDIKWDSIVWNGKLKSTIATLCITTFYSTEEMGRMQCHWVDIECSTTRNKSAMVTQVALVGAIFWLKQSILGVTIAHALVFNSVI